MILGRSGQVTLEDKSSVLRVCLEGSRVSASCSRKARALAVRKHLMVNDGQAEADNPKNLLDTRYATRRTTTL